MYECHLPEFVPLSAVDKLIIHRAALSEAPEIRDKVQSVILPDGRRLAELLVEVDDERACQEEMDRHFEARRRQCAAALPGAPPISVRCGGLEGRPVFLPADFLQWPRIRTGSVLREGELGLSFACRSTHDVQVLFANSTESQRPGLDLRDERWARSVYRFALGVGFNRTSFLSKGIKGQRFCRNCYFERSRDGALPFLTSLGCGEGAGQIWDRYWFHAAPRDGAVRLRCGKGPMFQNVLIDFLDTCQPVQNLRYIGISCHREPTVFCDLRAL